MVEQKIFSGQAVAVNEDEMVLARCFDCIVQHRVLLPAIVFVPEVNNRKAVAQLQHVVDNVFDFRTRTIVGDNHFKLFERLSSACSENESKIFRLVIDGDNEREFGNEGHAVGFFAFGLTPLAGRVFWDASSEAVTLH